MYIILEEIINKNIDESIKFEINRFKYECCNIYSSLLKDKIEKANRELFDKIDAYIKSNIIKNIGCSNLYDYSTLDEKNDSV